jgi:hypothetical protein
VSRVIVFGLDNKSMGEFRATVNRGYMVYGNPSVSGEQSVQIAIPDDIARKDWLQFGRLVLLDDPDKEPWVGVIDPPWKAMLPVVMTAYSAEYLLSLRTADNLLPQEGSAAAIIGKMVQLANAQEELFIRMGDTSGSDGTIRQEPIKQTKIWEQIRSFCERTNTELILRPSREADRLYLYIDLSTRVGIDTGYLLHDGEDANVVITDAQLVGTLSNRMIGVSSQNTQASRPVAGPLIDDDMIAKYRLRSEVVQFRDLVENNSLARNTQRALDYAANPRLQLTMNIQLVDTTLARYVRRGNIFRVHASELWLPGGIQGWSGSMRILKYFITETNNSANVTMEAFL